jgi:hypothetical protein
VIDLVVEGDSMNHEENRLNVDVQRLQKIGRRVTRLLRKECKDAVEAMYVVKGVLYLLRRELSEAGVVIGNEAELEAELDAELTSMIDRAMNECE